MRTISLLQPRKIVFGQDSARQCVEDVLSLGLRRIFIVTSEPILDMVEPVAVAFREGGAAVEVYAEVNREPSVALFEQALDAAARAMQPDAVNGLGGGSPMDVAKVVAALLCSQQTLLDVLGIDLLESRILIEMLATLLPAHTSHLAR